jgi:hypothetical protein
MSLGLEFVLMPRPRHHPVMTMWTVDKLCKEYSGEALALNLTGHLYRLVRELNVTHCRVACEDYILDPESEMHRCMQAQETYHYPVIDNKARAWGLSMARRLWERGNKLECVEHLIETSQRANWLGREIWFTTHALIKLIGYGDEIDAKYRSLLSRMPRRPATAERALHLHLSEHPAGGGDEELFFNRLHRSYLWLSHKITYPAWWDEARYAGFSAMYPHLRDLGCNDWQLLHRVPEQDASVKMLSQMLFRSYCLRNFVVNEIADMLHALNGWRKFTAGLALHDRVGKGSSLHRLGPDILRMVFAWM